MLGQGGYLETDFFVVIFICKELELLLDGQVLARQLCHRHHRRERCPRDRRTGGSALWAGQQGLGAGRTGTCTCVDAVFLCIRSVSLSLMALSTAIAARGAQLCAVLW